jgi:hypothetical protein
MEREGSIERGGERERAMGWRERRGERGMERKVEKERDGEREGEGEEVEREGIVWYSLAVTYP